MTYRNGIILFAYVFQPILVIVVLLYNVLNVPCDHVPPNLVYMPFFETLTYNNIENW